MPDADHGGAGLLESVRRIGHSVLALIQNRLSLAAVDLQEEKLRAISVLIWLCAAMALGVAGILVAIGALALFLWGQAGYAGLIGLAVLSLGGAVAVLWVLRRRILQGPQPFAATITEFEKDLQCLRPPQ
jgi:uncharacterized membrane protein YqjE